MKIKISQIDDSAFTVRESLEKEPLEELKESLRQDGQWDAILVRPVGDKFELIAGHRRVQAAKELEWTEIEANIKSVDDTEALFLALKTNLVREGMSEREQGKVLSDVKQQLSISEATLAKKIGKTQQWVNKRIRIALNLHQNVVEALESNKITMSVAEVISSLDSTLQGLFLIYILENNIGKDEHLTRKAKKRFQNTLIYTIGNEDRLIQNFIDVLKECKIEYILDIRQDPDNSKDPNYKTNNLKMILEKEKIKYSYNEELSVDPVTQLIYEEGVFPIECYERHYRGRLLKIVEIATVIDDIKDTGKTAILGYKKYAVSQRGQKTNCYRSILSTKLRETGEFKEVIHL